MIQHTNHISKKLVLLIFLCQGCFLPIQKTNSDVRCNVVSYEYIRDNIFITFSITNYNPNSIFVINRYWADNIKIENDIIFLTMESSWPPEKFYEMGYYPLNLFHIRENCQEIRSGQKVILSLLLKADKDIKNDMPIKVCGLRYINNFDFLDEIKNKKDHKEIYDIFHENIVYINCELKQSFRPRLL